MDMELTIDDDDLLSDNDFLDDDPEEDHEDNGDESGEESLEDFLLDIDDDHSESPETDIEIMSSMTIPRLTKYEMTNIIGLRATQIQKGSKPFVDIKQMKYITPILIAQEELKQHKLDFFNIKRILPSGKQEIISLKHLKF